MYDQEQFIKMISLGGYGTKEMTKKYIKEHPKAEYGTDDIIGVYEMHMHWSYVRRVNGSAHIQNGRTTAFLNGPKGNSGPDQDWI